MKQKILDIGCYDGKRVREEIAKGNDAWGIDINTKHFDHPNLYYCDIENDFFELPLIEEINLPVSFNKIYITEVLEHLDDDEIALWNIKLLLEPNGTLFLTTPRHIPFFNWYDPAWIKWKLGIGSRHYHYPLQELLDKLRKAGFKEFKICCKGNWKWLFLRWLNGIFRTKIKAPDAYGYFDWEITAK